MNLIQKLMSAFMLIVIGAVILFPEWKVKWTVRLDYNYYYEGDAKILAAAPPGAKPPSPFLSGSDFESHAEVKRTFLFPGPHRPLCRIPPPKTENTGTGFVDLGRRRTLYTNATVTDCAVRLNIAKMVWEVTVLLIPMALFIFMFRDRTPTPRITFTDRGASGRQTADRLGASIKKAPNETVDPPLNT